MSMGKIINWLGSCVILGLCGLTVAHASPPSMQRAAHERPALDLSPPPSTSMGGEKTSSAAFPSLHRQTLGGQEQVALPQLGAQGHIPSRYEELAQKFHREGLPVARLWENKAALVSLGLNQKGKPGLWITQKVH
jgi:hypothetical protein